MNAVRNGKRSHTGIPHSPHFIQYRGVRCGEGNFGSRMYPPGGAVLDEVGGGRAQPDILHGRQEDWWEGKHLGLRRPDDFSSDVTTNGTGDKPGEE